VLPKKGFTPFPEVVNQPQFLVSNVKKMLVAFSQIMTHQPVNMIDLQEKLILVKPLIFQYQALDTVGR